MKKLLLLLIVTFVSLNSMAMGFPQTTIEQQQALTKSNKRYEFVSQIQTLENKIKETVVSVTQQDTSMQESFVEMITDYVIHFFTDKIFDKKTIAVETIKGLKVEYVAIKKDFEFCFIG
jgi:hypothetical protein